MSHLGDDAEAFFQKGDDGTYDGGPQSLSPVARNAVHEADDLATEVTPEVLERRDRFQRMVKTIVGALGAGVLVMLPFRLGIAGGTSSATAATVVDVATPSAPLAEAPAPVAVTPGSPSNAPNATAAPSPPSHEVATQVHAAAPAKHVATKPVAHAALHSAPAHHPVALRPSNARSVFPAAAPSANGSLRTQSWRRASAVHVPPTASFPD